jgi:uncharacterized protein YndB with AHSA1/START domain
MSDILHRITIAAPTERVFEAITTSEGLRRWWTADSTAEPRVGSVAVFGFGNRATVFRMRIEELIPGKRVAWICLGDNEEWQGTRLALDLTPTADGGTNLRFGHREWRSVDGGYATCNTTWGHLMHYLKAYAEGNASTPTSPAEKVKRLPTADGVTTDSPKVCNRA